MVKHALRLSMALALGAGLGGIALAQQTAAPGPTPPPAQIQQPGAGMPGAGRPRQGAGHVEPEQLSGRRSEHRNAARPGGEPLARYREAGAAAAEIRGPLSRRDRWASRAATRAAVRRFQQQNGPTTNAMLDQETLHRLSSNHHG